MVFTFLLNLFPWKTTKDRLNFLWRKGVLKLVYIHMLTFIDFLSGKVLIIISDLSFFPICMNLCTINCHRKQNNYLESSRNASCGPSVVGSLFACICLGRFLLILRIIATTAYLTEHEVFLAGILGLLVGLRLVVLDGLLLASISDVDNSGSNMYWHEKVIREGYKRFA